MNEASIPNRLSEFSKLARRKSAIIVALGAALACSALFSLHSSEPTDMTLRARLYREANEKSALAECSALKLSGWRILKESNYGCAAAKPADSSGEPTTPGSAICSIVAVDMYGLGYFKHIAEMTLACGWSKVPSLSAPEGGTASTQTNSGAFSTRTASSGIQWIQSSNEKPLGYQVVDMKWIAAAGSISNACKTRFSMGQAAIGGCAHFGPKPMQPTEGICSFIAPADTNLYARSILGHEIKHCFDGNFHDGEQRPKTSFFKSK